MPGESVPKAQAQQPYGHGRTERHLSHKMLLNEEVGTITVGQHNCDLIAHTQLARLVL